MPGASGGRGRGRTGRNRGVTRGGAGRGSLESEVDLVASGARVGSAKRGDSRVTRARGSHGESGKQTKKRTQGSGQSTTKDNTDESIEEEHNLSEETNQNDGLTAVKDKKEFTLLQTNLKSVTSERDQLINLVEQKHQEIQTKLQEAVVIRKERDDLRDLLAETKHKYSLQEAKIKELETANDELRTRLSSHLGAQLQNMNPNIADLSDPNRPTRLADQFSSLYDDEWTNSFEVITTKAKRPHDEAVSMLLKACVEIYNHCIATASEELKKLHQILTVFNSEKDVTLLKQLKDRRKKQIPDERSQKDKGPDMNIILGDKLLKHKHIQKFCSKCLEICWLMAVQDPPVVMDTDINKRTQTFDNNTYRPYTKSGPLVDFIVWPALYLFKDGNLLSKGVAQGFD